MLAGFDCDITAELKSGDDLEIDPSARELRLIRPADAG
jgi:hypothetical protein